MSAVRSTSSSSSSTSPWAPWATPWPRRTVGTSGGPPGVSPRSAGALIWFLSPLLGLVLWLFAHRSEVRRAAQAPYAPLAARRPCPEPLRPPPATFPPIPVGRTAGPGTASGPTAPRSPATPVPRAAAGRRRPGRRPSKLSPPAWHPDPEWPVPLPVVDGLRVDLLRVDARPRGGRHQPGPAHRAVLVAGPARPRPRPLRPLPDGRRGVMPGPRPGPGPPGSGCPVAPTRRHVVPRAAEGSAVGLTGERRTARRTAVWTSGSMRSAPWRRNRRPLVPRHAWPLQAAVPEQADRELVIEDQVRGTRGRWDAAAVRAGASIGRGARLAASPPS